ncbi:MAG TPA: hypothetical protein VK742_18005 [Candidatus Sulfotelmatobacter sp.]|jgi:hypothetical protein|nr:hypothetical protein [Candidatus Sulfotelmatobacter sp.]
MSELQDSIKRIAKKICEAHQQLPGPEFVIEFGKLVEQMFLGEYAKTIDGIQAGEISAVEFGLVYLEVQPYFHRSQYIRTKLIRLLKHSPLSLAHAKRFKLILELEHDKKMKSPATAMRKHLGNQTQIN